MNKRGIAAMGFWVIVSVLVVGLLVSTNYISLGSIVGSGDYIERPVFKYVQCEAISDIKYSTVLTMNKDGIWLNKPSVSSSYDVKLKAPPSTLVTALASSHRFEYYVCNSQSLAAGNCRVIASKQNVNPNQEITIPGIKNNEWVWAQYQDVYTAGQIAKAASGATYQIGYVPYGLREYDPFSGKRTINPNDCTVAANDESWTDRLISTNSQKASTQIKNDAKNNQYSRTLQPQEYRNYVSGYVTSAAPSFKLTYKNQDAWCKKGEGSATIYRINTLQVGSGTYKIASVEYSDVLGTETCCPGDKEPGRACNSNFKWVSLQPIDNSGKTSAQCSSFNPCDGGEYSPYSKGVIARYACENNACVLKTKSVQCSSDADCSDSNQVCDRSVWQCKQANVNLDGQVLKTVADNAQDCKEQGGVWVSEKTEDKSLLNIIGIGSPKIITTSYCKYPKFPFGTIAWVFAAILAIIVFIRFRGPIMTGLRSILRF